MDDPWKQHRLLKRLTILGIVFICSIALLVASGHIDLRSRGMYLLGIAWVIFGVTMITFFRLVRCPQCGERFYANSIVVSQMTKKCLHCGIAKFADLSVSPRPRSVVNK
jgi:hypothetical protein